LLYCDYSSDPAAWAQTHFGQARMGQKARCRRLVTIAQAMALKPGNSIPHLFDRAYDVEAAYDFFARPEATPDNIQAAHRAQVREAAASRPGDVLLLRDNTFPSWSGKKPIAGLGPIGKGRKGQQGFLLHSVLAVRAGDDVTAAVEILGLIDQQYHVRRKSRARGEKKTRRHGRWRESMIWSQSVRRVGSCPNPACRWIDVCDREADIFEHMADCRLYGRSWVIRANQDRGLLDEHEGKRLFEVARQARPLGQYRIEIPKRRKSPGGVATMSVSVMSVCLRPPYRPKGKRQLEAMEVQVVCARETSASAKARGAQKPLEWVLLTDLEVGSLAEALRVIGYYAKRWLIEEFHRVLYETMGAERLQMEHGKKLMAAVAIKSVVALRVMDLREHLRTQPEAVAARSGLSETELKVLSRKLGVKLETVEDVAYALGRLGGHLKHNGPPGNRTLARGLMELQTLVAGYELAQTEASCNDDT
jgi:hypothetical protein